jgi:primosomal protein N'
MDKIKAMFFVKSFEGNKKYTYKYEDELFWVGDKVMVTFHDGEKLIGYTQQLDCSPRGFFITPADLKGNNKYVFASKSAIQSMSFF